MSTGPRFTVEFARAARDQLAALPTRIQKQVAAKIERLRDDPRPSTAAPMKGLPGTLRIKSGNFRILYEVNDATLVILVVKIGDRKDVYRGL